MAVTTLRGIDAVRSALGTHLGYSDWLEITQDRVDIFADATGDHQWIHVDIDKAKNGPFGAPIAHGYLTLSLSNMFLPQIVEVLDVSMGINYGADSVRFPAPVVVGTRIRAGAELIAVTDITNGVQTTIRITIETDGGAKPNCVIDSLSRWMI
ncbi:MAG: MaoC family dehydratase [Ilumatobacteraceae bacterium]|nr:MaoC family dehydratase [Ilumatobacteraceae bacterium]